MNERTHQPLIADIMVTSMLHWRYLKWMCDRLRVVFGTLLPSRDTSPISWSHTSSFRKLLKSEPGPLNWNTWGSGNQR